ncbi:MAG: hypothetical protein E7608_06285 [Ruminococcaceae bacterium]|nr:hypothetical protein [Oscillospiraceae bacterium]
MSNAIYIKDLGKLEEFINNIDALMGMIYLSQNEVNAAYNRVDDWNDKVFIYTGGALFAAGDKIEDVGYFLSEKMDILNEYGYRINCEYAGYAEWNGKFTNRELEVKLNLEADRMVRAILGTKVEGIMNFERALEKYIEDTDKNVQSVVRELDIVSEYWNDANFRKIEEYVLDFQDDMRENLDDLSEMLNEIIKRRKKLEEADNVGRKLG